MIFLHCNNQIIVLVNIGLLVRRQNELVVSCIGEGNESKRSAPRLFRYEHDGLKVTDWVVVNADAAHDAGDDGDGQRCLDLSRGQVEKMVGIGENLQRIQSNIGPGSSSVKIVNLRMKCTRKRSE